MPEEKLVEEARDKLSKHREAERKRNEERRTSGRNIGELPEIVDPARRESCSHNLELFLNTYIGEELLPFSDDHKRVIRRIEDAVFHGGRFCEAVYRGFGKTTISEGSAIWAALYGHKRFIVIVGANSQMGEDIMESIQGLLMSDQLLEDFPEVCFPVIELAGITQRAHGQMYQGELTNIEWTKDEIKLPTMPDSISSGIVICARGILSSKLRGMRKYNKDGTRMRPDYILIDDPQTEQSASNEVQVKKRLNVINKALLKSSSHQSRVSVVMPCTVIETNDLVDQLLDHNKNPSWQGERIPMVKQWADLHDEFWMQEYGETRTKYDPTIAGDQMRAHKEANELYASRKEDADRGCVVSWDHCYDQDLEISSIQHAYNALIDDGEEVFASEYQNQPLLDDVESSQLSSDQVLEQMVDRERGTFSDSMHKLTAFVDVQKTCLYWMVCSWGKGFSGHIIDYGVFPKQDMAYFELKTVRHTLQKQYPGAGLEGCWRAGMKELCNHLLERDYRRDDGALMRIDRLMIDANDGNAAQTIFDYVNESVHKSSIMPSRGRGVTAAQTPFGDYSKKRGDIIGLNWRIPAVSGKSSSRYILADVNFWKSFVRSRMQTAVGDNGSISIYKHAASSRNQMLVSHFVSEYSIKTEGRGRTVDQWAMRPGTENHWFDCLIGCAIGASSEGIALDGSSSRKGKKPRVSFAELQAQARGNR